MYEFLFDTSTVEDEGVHFTKRPAFCLMPLPQTINWGQSIDTGMVVVEPRGTSSVVGQCSPEQHPH
jgi:hypothetical protein